MNSHSETDHTGSKALPKLRQLFRNTRGSASIEFALLALPFSLMLFATLETCISFGAQKLLANATDDVARQLRTGQIKKPDMTEVKLKKMICDQISVIVSSDCPGLLVDLREFPTFEEAAKIKIKYTTGNDVDVTGFDVKPGLAGSKNMLRVFYKWPVMTDILKLMGSSLADRKTLHFAVAIWQNEPFNN